MKIKVPKGIKSREDFLDRFLKIDGKINNKLLDIMVRPATIKIVVDAECDLHISIISRSRVRVCLDTFKRDFFGYDYDSAKEWVFAVYNFVSGLVERKVTVKSVKTKKGKRLCHRIILDDGTIYYTQLYSLNLLSIFFKRKSSKIKRYYIAQPNGYKMKSEE